jgi:hypothetical protein
MYAKKSDDVWIAYQVIGDVARDLVWVNAWVSHLEIDHSPRTPSLLTERSRAIMCL